MSDQFPNSASLPDVVTAQIKLSGGDWELNCKVNISTGPTLPMDLLPLARALSDGAVSEMTRAVEKAGMSVSCKAGCGACCRLLVSISELEARALRDLVAAMPEPRQSQVRARFADAIAKYEEAGLLEDLRHTDQLTQEKFEWLTKTYFEQRVPCPFLEEESCSIHPDRPVTCREYIVTSPAEHCARYASGEIRRVRIPLPIFNALAQWNVEPSAHYKERWVPLVLALEWSDAHPDSTQPRPGHELLKDFISIVSAIKQKHALPAPASAK